MARLCTNIENSDDVPKFDDLAPTTTGQTRFHSNTPINLDLYSTEEYVKKRLESDEEQIEFVDNTSSSKLISSLTTPDSSRTKRVDAADDQNENNHVNNITENKSFYQYVQNVSKLPCHQPQTTASKVSENGNVSDNDTSSADLLELAANNVDDHESDLEQNFKRNKTPFSPKSNSSSDYCQFESVAKSPDVRSKRVKKPSLKFLESVGSDPDPGELKKMLSQKVTPKKEATADSVEGGFLSPTQGTSTPLWSSLTESQLAILVKDLVSQKGTELAAVPKENNPRQYIDREWVPWPILGSGWYRFEVHRKNGQSAGRCDVYYLSPSGKKVRSKPELQIMLKDKDLTNFNFRIGEYTDNGKKKKDMTLKKLQQIRPMPENNILSNPKEILSILSMLPSIKREGIDERQTKNKIDNIIVGYKEKSVRCKECKPCLRENCGECINCRDMKKFGGSNSKRQTCVHRRCQQQLKVKIAVKGKRPHCDSLFVEDIDDTPITMATSKRIKLSSQNSTNGTLSPSVIFKKIIDASPIPVQFGLPSDHILDVRISDRVYKCPLVWVDDIFHQTAITHYFQHGVEKISAGPWPSVMTDFYNFVFSVSVTIDDIKLQFHVVEKIKIQSIKMTNWVLVHGAHSRDLNVDLEFYNFLESIELYQYLPNHPKNPKNVVKEEPNFEDEMAAICKQLEAVIRSNDELDSGIKELLLKYIEKGDLCTFILAVVNAQNIPCSIELAVIDLLKSQLNLSDITNLTDLTGSAIEKSANKKPSMEPSTVTSLNEALSNITPSNKPLDERVKSFIVNEPIKVVEFLNELQKADKTLTVDVLSDIILEHLKLQTMSITPPLQRNIVSPSHPRTPSPHHSSPRNIPSPQQFAGFLPGGGPAVPIVPPGYNPRYYTPNLGPQHQQRYGRPPLRRNTVLQQSNAVRPPAALHPNSTPRWPALTPPTPPLALPLPPPPPPVVPPVMIRLSMVDKSVQVSPATSDNQQQIDCQSIADSAATDKFVDLNFCPHV